MAELICPRDGSQLSTATEHHITVDHCSTCSWSWYDNDELEILESTVADADTRRGMIDYAKRESELKCPLCKKQMQAFNYRAYNLELDACVDSHGFWLDAHEADRVREIMEERIKGLARAGVAESEWNDAKRGKKSGITDKFKGMFGGKH